ncbi:pur operon repressor [Lactococcus termiticola]|uniref:Purine operon repressor n=1 Tax=Lactococcus termiticola TaxID=2169526 RepID=A0A2R5HL29_9LACT|nr:pur operon repressor [Lactococcus termiticola]GBG97481.1 purine operon repressor [Lactococcus termiticola]
MKRNERLIDFTNHLINRPNQMLNLNQLSKHYEVAKSSISEDLVFIKRVFERQGIGKVETFPGSLGGVKFSPDVTDELAKQKALDIIKLMEEDNRILPGGYIYLSDILGTPKNLKSIGQIIAHEYLGKDVDVVMTIATKGIPIAQAVAEILDVPFVIVRRDAKVTEGATLNVNYTSGSSSRVENMTLSKRSLSIGQRVLIVDDFMKGAGTINGMKSLVHEFDCFLAGVAVFLEGPFRGERLVEDYKSILRVDSIDVANRSIDVKLGNIFDKNLDLFEEKK